VPRKGSPMSDAEPVIEQMIEECLEAVEADSDAFTEWEVEFLESIEDQNEDRHLTEKQINSLTEIWEEKVHGS